MTRSLLQYVVFLAGLAVVAWVGIGYAGSNPLALAMTLLIGAVYLAGVLELQRYRRATGTLSQAVGNLSSAPAGLEGWLATLHASLRNAVRLRVEGVRAALPGPALAPYLTGFLVLLGMLGTFLGMIATLRGTSLALETGTDLQAIRDSLAAPVKGLGFAFGTSVAGVAASAMLGLLSALCQRERAQAVQGLDAHIATTLRSFSPASQREETFKLMQRQADALPALADRMQAMLTAMERQAQAINERLANGQDALGERLSAGQQALSDRLLANHEALSERLASGHLALGERINSNQQALDERLCAKQETLLQQQATAQEALQQRLTANQAAFQARADAAYERLAESAAQSLQAGAAASARAAGEAIEPAVQAALAGLARDAEAWRGTMLQTATEQLEAVAHRFAESAANVAERLAETSTQLSGHLTEATTQVTERLAGTGAHIAEHCANTTAAATERFAATTAQITDRLDGHAQALVQGSTTLLDGLAQRSAALLDTLEQSQASLHATLAERDEQRLSGYTRQLDAQAATLRQGWEETNTRAADQHRQLCDTLARTADDIAAQAEARTQGTLAEVARIMHAAEQAPLAVAEVIGELRRKQSEGLERDNTMLEERTRLLETLGTLLDTVNQSATRQREAIDALIASSGEKLENIGERFAQATEAQADKLATVAESATSKLADVSETQAGKLAQAAANESTRLASMAEMAAGKLASVAVAVTETLTSAAETAADKLATVTESATGKLAGISEAQAGMLMQVTETEAGKLAQVAGQISDSSAQTAALGEAFNTALQSFSQSNAALAEQLQRVEAALDKSMTRSDEQLAYYVAQAREVVDLSLLSQKQILEDLQRVAKA